MPETVNPPPPFVALAELCVARGEDSLSTRTPAGESWPMRVDATWSVWINPHAAPVQLEIASHAATVQVPAHSAYVTYNDSPWAVIDAFGGIHPVHGRCVPAWAEEFAAGLFARAALAAAEEVRP
ncbi:MAG TPA: hypothetical protein VFR37_08530 [Longimicrobium sp.]|nr:hypothetical protein [Longimicrobium sp.]